VNDVCFMITPLGHEGTAIRKRADDLFDYVIEPAARSVGLRAERPDRIHLPGLITEQIIEHILDDRIVVADCHGWNVNVFYELSLRHVIGKPVIHLIAPNDVMPFDAYDARAIPVDHHDLASAKAAEELLRNQMQEMLEPEYRQRTPIARAIQWHDVGGEQRHQSDDGAAAFRLVADELREINARLATLEFGASPSSSMIVGVPVAIALTASPAVVAADGTSATIRAKITDALGVNVPDGEQVVWTIDGPGTLDRTTSLTIGGSASVMVTPFVARSRGRLAVMCSAPKTGASTWIYVDYVPVDRER